MSYKNHQSKKDKGHTGIVKALQSAGIQTIDLSINGKGCADLLTLWFDVWCLIELKTLDGKFSRKQLETMASWKSNIGFATDSKEALELARHPSFHALTQTEKSALDAWLIRNPNQKEIRINPFLKVIGRKELDNEFIRN